MCLTTKKVNEAGLFPQIFTAAVILLIQHDFYMIERINFSPLDWLGIQLGIGKKRKIYFMTIPSPTHQLYQFLNLNLFVSLKSGLGIVAVGTLFFLAEFLILISIQHF